MVNAGYDYLTLRFMDMPMIPDTLLSTIPGEVATYNYTIVNFNTRPTVFSLPVHLLIIFSPTPAPQAPHVLKLPPTAALDVFLSSKALFLSNSPKTSLTHGALINFV